MHYKIQYKQCCVVDETEYCKSYKNVLHLWNTISGFITSSSIENVLQSFCNMACVLIYFSVQTD